MANAEQKASPKVNAFKLSNDGFNHVLHHRRGTGDGLRDPAERGRAISTKCAAVCVFNADETDASDYIILVRENHVTVWTKSSSVSYRVMPEDASKLQFFGNGFSKQS